MVLCKKMFFIFIREVNKKYVYIIRLNYNRYFNIFDKL